MNGAHVLAVAVTLLIDGVLAAAFFGWGKVCLRLAGSDLQGSRSVTGPIWIGWTFTLLLFQVLRFVAPINVYGVVPVLAAGMAFAIPPAIREYRCQDRQRVSSAGICGIALLLLAATWATSRSMLKPAHYDSGLYHFNSIRWINEFPAVVGLGNLHGRFAFNQSFFTYVAALNFHPLFNQGRSVANGFLLLLTLATLIEPLWALRKQNWTSNPAHPFRYGAPLLALSVLLYIGLDPMGYGITSPSTDFASVLLQIVMMTALCQGIGEWRDTEQPQGEKVVLLCLVAVTAVTVKLSNIAFSATIIGICAIHAWRVCPRRTVLLSGALALSMGAVWLIHGILLSGAPLYPSVVGHIDVDWAVPKARIMDEAKWIYSSWTRQAGVQAGEVVSGRGWLPSWLAAISNDLTGIVYPVVISALFVVAGVIMSLVKPMVSRRALEWVILLPLIAGLCFWCLTSPAPRYANALFLLLPMGAALLLLVSIRSFVSMRPFAVLACIVIFAATFHVTVFAVSHRRVITTIATTGWHAVPKVAMREAVTESGLMVRVPIEGNQCWDASLPCTPYFNSKLRLRKPGDTASGFTVRTKE